MRILSRGNIEGEIGKDILVCKKATPDAIEYILKSKAVIVEEGGLLSHASIICRELNIPCVQIDNATKVFKKGTPITGLNWVYGEVINDIDNFLQKYKNLDFKAIESDNEILVRIGKIMINNIKEHLFETNSIEDEEWIDSLKSPFSLFEKAKTSGERIIAISWTDKIIRASSL